MTVVPLPDVPCVRCRLVYIPESGQEAGSRFYLSYSGSAPTGGNCSTLATEIKDSWVTRLAPLVADLWQLIEVDVLDIATNTGFSGSWTGSVTGTRGSPSNPQQLATNVEFGIARRYRGGKPRMFFPPGLIADTETNATWTSGYIAAVNTGFGEFFSDLTALSIGAMGTLNHVNLSYYKGFTNIANSSGRERAVPTYRATALHDPVESYNGKVVMGSQRRRRTSTTP